MHRYASLLLVLGVGACNADVASTAAAVGTARNEETRQTQELKEQVRQRLEAATQSAHGRLEEAEQGASR